MFMYSVEVSQSFIDFTNLNFFVLVRTLSFMLFLNFVFFYVHRGNFDSLEY